MSPLANSPPSSTPEPEMGSLPQDAAIVPHSATPQVLTGNNTHTVDTRRHLIGAPFTFGKDVLFIYLFCNWFS